MTTHLTHRKHSTVQHSAARHPAVRRTAGAWSRAGWSTVLGGALAVTAAALVARAGAAAAGIRLTVRSGEGTREVGWVSTAVVAFLAAAAAFALLKLLARRTHGVPAWTCAAVVVLLISLAGPLGATTLTAGLILLSLHLVVASAVAGVAYRVGHCWS